MSDKIIIGADLDLSTVEKKLSELQNKIKSFTNMNPGAAGLGGLGGGNQQLADRMKQNQLKMEKRLYNEVTTELGNQLKVFKDIAKQVSDQEKNLKSLNRTTKEYAQTKQKISELTKQELDAQVQISRLQSQKNSMQGMMTPGGLGAAGNAFAGGGMGGLRRHAQRNYGGLMGLAGSAISGVGGLLAGGGQLASQYGQFQGFRAGLPARQAGRELGIAQGTTQLRGRAIRGENLDDILFAEERGRAIDKTMGFFSQADSARGTRAKGKAALGVGGVIAGAGAGALMGSAIMPGIGTAIGGAIGGIGAGLGIFGGSEEAYYGLTGNKGALSQMTGEEAMQKYETFKMQERLSDPTKYYQKKMYGENRGSFLSAQRSGGLGDEQLYGSSGYLRQGSQDFLLSNRMGMSGQIVGAGGSGSAAYGGGLNNLALQAQRSMGLTNSGQALGKLSGYMKASESEDAFVRILSKGVSIGLDDSSFREEQKDYLTQVTAIASKIGGGQEMVAASLAAGIEGDISRRGVQMSADGFGALEGALNQQGGVTAASRAGLISSNPAFSNIKGMDRLSFQKMQMKDIREDSDVMKMYYEKAGGQKGSGVSYEDFVNQRQDTQRKSLFQAYKGTPIGDKLSGSYEAGKKRKLTSREISEAQEMLKLIPEFEGKSEEELKRITKMYLGTERIEEGDKATKKYEDAYTGRRSGAKPMFGDRPLTTRERIAEGEGVGADKEEKARAIQQSKQFENMSENIQTMFKTVFSNLDQTLAQQVEMEEFNKKLSSGGAALQAFMDILDVKNTRESFINSAIQSGSITKEQGQKMRKSLKAKN